MRVRGTRHLREARRTLGLGLGLALFVTLFVDVAVLVVPIYDMQLYDRVLLSRNMNTVAMLSFACGVGLLIYGVLDYLRSATLVTIGHRIGRTLSVPVLEAAVRRGMEGDGAAGVEAMRDLHEVRSFLASGAVAKPLDALCAPLLIAVMFMLHPAFGWLGVAGTSLLTIMGIVTDMLVRPGLVAASEARARAGNQFATGLREADLIDGLGMFPALARTWADRHAAALARMRSVEQRSQGLSAITKILRLALQAGVMALGVVLILSRQASPGSLMGANLLLGKVLGPFDSLVSSWRHWVEAAAAWRRISSLLSADHHAALVSGTVESDETGLVLHNVGFRDLRSGGILLEEIDIRLAAGTATALVGPNGAGKSTLLRLIVGLLRPTDGAVRLDGVPIESTDRRRIGYLPQGVGLLDATIAENLARFQDAPARAVIEAAAAADVHEMIGRLSHGYDTRAGQDAPLSGGQKQRLGLARALFDRPRLLVLDEPDASLDGPGEAALIRAIMTARAAGAIVVVATHRPTLLARMDFELTLKDRRVASFEARAGGEPVAGEAAPRSLAPSGVSPTRWAVT